MNHRTPISIPNLKGKTALITGATSGLGYESALILAEAGAKVYLHGRDRQKLKRSKSSILINVPSAKVKTIKADLMDLDKVDKIPRKIEEDQLDILINNAGIMMPPYQASKQGFESQWAVNVLAHFKLSTLLWPKLQAASAAQVVNLSSLAAKNGEFNWNNLNNDTPYKAWPAYAQSKLAMLVFSLEWQKRLPAESKVKVMAAHPGMSDTNLFKHLEKNMPLIVYKFLQRIIAPMLVQSAQRGALPQIMAATREDLPGGSYVGPSGSGQRKGLPKVVPIPKSAQRNEGAKFWEAAEEACGLRFEL